MTTTRTRLVVRLGLVAVALVATWLALRALAPRAGADADGPTYLAYRVPLGQPLAFPVGPRDEDFLLTAHLETGPESPPHGTELTYAVVALLEDAQGAVRWRGRAVVTAPPIGALAEGARPLSSPRTLELALPPVDATGGRLVVLVEPTPAAGAAVLRLVRRAARPQGWQPDDPHHPEPRARQQGNRASLFGWPYLDVRTLHALAREPLVRRSADTREGDADLVHVALLVKGNAPPPAEAPGELLHAGRGAAWTVRGPGELRVALVPEGASRAPVPVELRTVDHRGVVNERGLAVAVDGAEATFRVPEDGALTVTVVVDAAAVDMVRARAFGAGGAFTLGADAPKAAGDVLAREVELRPDRKRLPLWRLRPGSPAVVATLAGDGIARVLARPALGGGPDAAAPPRLAWRLLTADGAPIAQGETTVTPTPAPFEVVRAPWRARALLAAAGALDASSPPAEPVPAAGPTALAAAGPPGSRLELTAAAGVVDVQLAAPDDAPEPVLPPAYEVPLERARLRFAPWIRQRWIAFLPDNHDELARAGAGVMLEAQVRLEPTGSAPPPAGPYVTIDPAAPRTRQLLVERDDPPGGWRPFHRAGFATGEPARLLVSGTGPATGRLLLDTLLGPEALGGALRVRVDGALVEERLVDVARGRVRLRGIDPGVREVVVEGAPGLILTGARAVAGGTRYAERAVWRLDRGGALTVPVRLRAGQTRVLNVVLYADEAPAEVGPLAARVLIDEGRRGPAVRATGIHTRVVREVPLAPEAVQAVWLDRADGPRARAHFAIRVGADLGPGVHPVRVTLLRGPARVHARFFITGSAREATVSRAGVEWEED